MTILFTIFLTLYIPMPLFIAPMISLNITSPVGDILYFLIMCICCCCNILGEDEFGDCPPFVKFKPTSLVLLKPSAGAYFIGCIICECVYD